MCNASEAVYERGMIKGEIKGEERGIKKGEERGEMKKAKETTFPLAARGMTVSDIAEILKVSEKQVEEWLAEAVSLA